MLHRLCAVVGALLLLACLTESPASAQGQPGYPSADAWRKWGAVAYTSDGAFGAAFGIDTEEEAVRLAVDACMRQSTEKADCSRGVVRGTGQWFYIQFCQRDSSWTTDVTSRRTLAETLQAAADFVQRTPRYSAADCRLAPNGLLHSGGLHVTQ